MAVLYPGFGTALWIGACFPSILRVLRMLAVAGLFEYHFHLRQHSLVVPLPGCRVICPQLCVCKGWVDLRAPQLWQRLSLPSSVVAVAGCWKSWYLFILH